MDKKETIAHRIDEIRKQFNNKHPNNASEKGRIEFDHETAEGPFINFANFRTDFHNWDQFSQFDNFSNFQDTQT